MLYIDDLDRCKSDRVIAVLEAVHLLLAFPIFAVVVAVDPRWLRRSLIEHYPTLLSTENGTSAKPEVVPREFLASPQDYLEKIFQVPFQLLPMEEDGFGTLVDQLLPARPVPRKQEQLEPSLEKAKTATLPKGTLENLSPSRERKVELSPHEDTAGVVAATPSAHTPQPGPKNEPETETKPFVIVPERLQLEEWEQAAIKLCHPLFRTPRAVKRLANTYCLIRTGVDSGSWTAFIGTDDAQVAEYRTPLLMLAVGAAFPGIAGRWFEQVAKDGRWTLAEGAKTRGEKDRIPANSEEWNALTSALQQMNAETFAPFDAKRVKDWLPKVKRYSF